MENLAYLHLFCAYEAPDEPELTFQLDLGKFSSQTSLFALKVLVPLGILLSAGSALALQRGDSGAAVTNLQQDLRVAGYFDLEPTGRFGSITEDAVKQFQQDRGLSVDGIAGPATLQALRNCTSSATIQPVSFSNGGLRLGSQGDEVRELQRQLQSRGYRIAADGVFGPDTDRAVQHFQEVNGLVADGVVGPATRDALASNGQFRPVAANRPITSGRPEFDPIQPGITSNGLRRGDRGEAVRQLQEQLRRQEFYTGPIDGIFGAQTEDAVRRFQGTKSLNPTGVADSQTLAALGLFNNQASRYLVVIPASSGATERDVRRYVRDAYLRNHPRGTFIQAGAYTSRQPAEERSRSLRQVGFDSRVEHF
jgi:peptidoglycan hydrolase-like protein with peptidoglycan-binding domain